MPIKFLTCTELHHFLHFTVNNILIITFMVVIFPYRAVFLKPKQKLLLKTITRDTENTVNESKLELNTCNWHEVRENECEWVEVDFRLNIGRQFFEPIVKCSSGTETTFRQLNGNRFKHVQYFLSKAYRQFIIYLELMHERIPHKISRRKALLYKFYFLHFVWKV